MSFLPKPKLVWLAVVFFLQTLVSCVHELPAPETPTPVSSGSTGSGSTGSTAPPVVTCSADTVYFNNTILPMINSLCGKSGCHGVTNRNAFAMTSYASIVSRLGTTGRLSSALQDMGEKRNPNYTPPSADQLAQLQKWIAQGAKNNTCNSCDTTKFTYAAVISPILDTYCRGCHNGPSGSGGVDLSTLSAVQSEIQNNPGRLLGSIAWTSPYTGTKQMPSGGSQLSACMITQVKKWIAAGAPNN